VVEGLLQICSYLLETKPLVLAGTVRYHRAAKEELVIMIYMIPVLRPNLAEKSEELYPGRASGQSIFFPSNKDSLNFTGSKAPVLVCSGLCLTSYQPTSACG